MEEPLLLYPENYTHVGFPSWNQFYSLRENQGDFFMKKKIIFLGILSLVLFASLSFNFSSKQAKVNDISVAPIIKDIFSYKGEQGKDALTILKQKFSVSQNNSGMVSAISGKKADAGKREYWAFYVNGKMANVGPADYKTRNSDLIEWKIEKY